MFIIFFYTIFLAPIVDFYEEIASSLSEDEGKKVRKNVNNDYFNENELKLQCCVLMLDVMLKQVLNKYLARLVLIFHGLGNCLCTSVFLFKFCH